MRPMVCVSRAGRSERSVSTLTAGYCAHLLSYLCQPITSAVLSQSVRVFLGRTNQRRLSRAARRRGAPRRASAPTAGYADASGASGSITARASAAAKRAQASEAIGCDARVGRNCVPKTYSLT